MKKNVIEIVHLSTFSQEGTVQDNAQSVISNKVKAVCLVQSNAKNALVRYPLNAHFVRIHIIWAHLNVVWIVPLLTPLRTNSIENVYPSVQAN